MLHDYAGGFTERFHALERCIGVSDVVIGECLALNLLCGRNRGFFYLFFYIEGSLLVAVLSVTHILLLNEVQVQRTREAAGRFSAFAMISRHQATEVVGDHAVVRGGVLECFDGEVETRLQRQRPFVGIHLINNGVVVAALHHDGNIFMVLSR